jgi:chromosomal replication initiation ATPase DnaA
MKMMYRRGGVSLSEIGKAMGGLDYTTVIRKRKRLREKAQQGKSLGRVLSEIEKSVRHK